MPTPSNNDDLNQELRQAVNNAYAFVEGEKNNSGFSSMTIEELLDRQIETIQGLGPTTSRPNRLDKISRVIQEVKAAVEKIKALPPEYFNEQSSTNNVNTK